LKTTKKRFSKKKIEDYQKTIFKKKIEKRIKKKIHYIKNPKKGPKKGLTIEKKAKNRVFL